MFTTVASRADLELDEGLTTVRSPLTSNHPADRRTGDRSMNEPLHLAGVDHFAHDRIAELRATAAEVRGPRRDGDERAGLLTRTRGTVGRRLISLGSAVAGHGA
jgi:hypothetical protein